MKKLSKAQLACIEEMKKDIDLARSCDTLFEYLLKTDSFLRFLENPREYFESHKEHYLGYKESYEDAKNGIVLVGHYGKPTLKALEKTGIISVVEFSEYRNSGVIDKAKLNNY